MLSGRECWWNPRVLLTLFLVFACGSVTGALVYRASSHSVAANNVAAFKEGGKILSVKHLQKELELTPDQTQEIESALDDFTMYYQSVHAQMDEIRSTGKSRIEAVLTEPQRKKFRKMMSDLMDHSK